MSDIKLTAKDRLAVAGAPLGDAVKRHHLSTQIKEPDKKSNSVEHLDTLHDPYLLQNCFSVPKLYFFEKSTCFAEKTLSKHYDDSWNESLSKVKNMFFTDILLTQSVLPS